MKPSRLMAVQEVGVTAAIVAAVWILTERSGNVFLPPLRQILEVFARDWFGPAFLEHGVPSIRRLLTGFGIAAVVGVSLGLVLGLSPTIRDLTRPVLTFFRSIPASVQLPLAMILFGITDAMQIAIIAIVCTFPILLNTEDGVAGIDSIIKDTARTYSIRGASYVWWILLPAIAPRVFVGLRISLSLAVLMVVISEMIASFKGIGYYVNLAQMTFLMPEMWAGIVVLGLLGYSLNAVLMVIERRLLRWYLEPKQNLGSSDR